MKKRLWFLFLVFVMSSASGHAAKSTYFSQWINIVHKRPNPFNPNYWVVNDAAWIVFNPSTQSNRVSVTVTADNANFRFGGVQCQNQIGTEKGR